MTWKYDPGVLPTSLSSATTEQKKNAVRLLVGDTNSSRELIQDEAIVFFLNTEQNIYMAAARVAIAISQDILAGGMEDQKVGETRIRMKKASELLQMANDLRRRGMTYQLPSAGGVFEADRIAEEEDTSKLQPAISKGMHDMFESIEPGGRRTVGEDDA